MSALAIHSDRTFECSEPATPAAVTTIRRQLLEWIKAEPVTSTANTAALLLVSNLTVRAVVGGAPITVRAALDGDDLVVDVQSAAFASDGVATRSRTGMELLACDVDLVQVDECVTARFRHAVQTADRGPAAVVIDLRDGASPSVMPVRSSDECATALQAVSTILLVGGDVEDAVHVVGVHARQIAGADVAGVAMRDGDAVWISTSDGGITEAHRGSALSAIGLLAATALGVGVVETVANGEADTFARGVMPERAGMGSVALIPLATCGVLLGVIAIGRRQDGEPFDEQMLRRLTSFAAQTAVLLELGVNRPGITHLAQCVDRDRIARRLQNVVFDPLLRAADVLYSGLSLAEGPLADRLRTAASDIDAATANLRSVVFTG